MFWYLFSKYIGKVVALWWGIQIKLAEDMKSSEKNAKEIFTDLPSISGGSNAC